VVLLHRIRSRPDALFAPEFAQLARTGDLRGYSLLGPRSTGSGWWGGKNRLDPAAEVTRLVPDVADREVYVCGPAPWMTQVQQTLQQLGVPRTAIHAEEFSW